MVCPHLGTSSICRPSLHSMIQAWGSSGTASSHHVVILKELKTHTHIEGRFMSHFRESCSDLKMVLIKYLNSWSSEQNH